MKNNLKMLSVSIVMITLIIGCMKLNKMRVEWVLGHKISWTQMFLLGK